MENKVIAKEYVEKNYISKTEIKEMIKNREDSIDDISSNLEWDKSMIEEIERLKIEIDVLENILIMIERKNFDSKDPLGWGEDAISFEDTMHNGIPV